MAQETIVQRQRREAAEYTAKDAPLAACNAAARKEAEAARKSASELTLAAMEAVARAMGGASVAASDVLKSVTGKGAKNV